ncbi:MAG: response regulator transcription factor [Alphaproteobacteria bacterium]|nr:MAG: response regulator transcription factor [Alphaproteobacteria bacterium]
MKILLIEDDNRMATAISMMLKTQGMICEHETSGFDGFESARLSRYDAIILDMALPDVKGEEVIERLRTCDIQTPILVLSCISDTNQVVNSLMNGADDYLFKPFDKNELIARLTALIRRSNGYASSCIKIGRLTIDLQARTAFIDEEELQLTKKEYSMLELLSRRKNAILNKDAFLDHLYDAECDEPTKKIVDVFVCKLRSKIREALKDNYDNAPEIETVWGRGYKLVLKPQTKQISGSIETYRQEKVISDKSKNDSVPRKKFAKL